MFTGARKPCPRTFRGNWFALPPTVSRAALRLLRLLAWVKTAGPAPARVGSEVHPRDCLAARRRTPDASRALAVPGDMADAFGQAWHLPIDLNRQATRS